MPSFALRFTATRLQASTYLLCVCLFSISFLVFLNATVSFVITDRIGQKKRVGDAVGTLGFADELVVLVACPIWGLLSDRIGLRAVAVCGYLIVGVALVVFVQAKEVYPDLLLGRVFFALGAAATATMVTAIMPSMTHKPVDLSAHTSTDRSIIPSSHNVTPSISSELTITPTRFRSQHEHARSESGESNSQGLTSQLAGLVGMCTGLGALVALGLFLPLPTRFQAGGVSPADAVAYSFYVVGAVALLVATICFFGLRDLPGEEYKGWSRLFQSQSPKPDDAPDGPSLPSYPQMLFTSLSLAFKDVDIGLGYLGGFVARASSVAISLFIPLFVNHYFITSGLCPENPDETLQDPGEVKRNCARAYQVASMLTGVSQLVALLSAPLFGYLNAQYPMHKIPLLLASAAGAAGYVAFGMLKSPDPKSEDGSFGIYFIVTLLGISQIGAIVCSLDLINRGIQTEDPEPAIEDDSAVSNENGTASPLPAIVSSGSGSHVRAAQVDGVNEFTPLMPSHLRRVQASPSRKHLKGSIAGIYSWCGGVGILLLTKLVGFMFDKVDIGTPFFMMAGFNAVLLITASICVAWQSWKDRDGYETVAEEEYTVEESTA